MKPLMQGIGFTVTLAATYFKRAQKVEKVVHREVVNAAKSVMVTLRVAFQS